ncbi:MAG: FHIPEP family type III secretion protein, partial [Gluconacetobacter diazotrophicus]|nr:FHIPEP family type III secretion protein [Gluconacetobacter diazotrophicus]
IISVNLLGGIAIGCVQHGMSFGEAGSTYSLLAIGDGLIAQIPALLISLTAGLIVTRVGADGQTDLGKDVVGQIGADPRVLIVAACIMLALGLIPGFPKLVFLLLAAATGAAGWLMVRHRRRRSLAEEAAMRDAIEDLRGLSVMQVRLSPGLMDRRAQVEAALLLLHKEMAEEFGVSLPRLQVAEALEPDAPGLRLDMNQIPLLTVPLRPSEIWLEAPGRAEARRVGPGGREWTVLEAGAAPAEARALDAVAMIPLFARDTILRSAPQLVGIQETQVLLNRIEGAYGDLVREAMRSAPLPRLADVFRRLVAEGVSLRNMRQVLESIAEWAPRESNPALLAEYVRCGLRQQICHAAAGADMTLHTLLVEDELAAELLGSLRSTVTGEALYPSDAELLVSGMRQRLQEAVHTGRRPVIVTTMELRRHLRELLHRHGFDACVMSHSEVANGFRIDVIGTLGRDAEGAGRAARRTGLGVQSALRPA